MIPTIPVHAKAQIALRAQRCEKPASNWIMDGNAACARRSALWVTSGASQRDGWDVEIGG
ncbi:MULTISPECIES: hypothetical protein [unclassified Rhizobium]|uniref:hypothetical protein n=1 Tax=unclassified Rhizobium TaxID=2613769 RepID=UPI000CDF506E|nr:MULTISPECIES: hypothetical protein [Rhizobium]AVA23683.1 hypothetical protein NXC24_PA00035 [Rhizobium sp. NXC24]UWU25958.1 hypothetical protein N2601_33360 [Rhizobium tropici]